MVVIYEETYSIDEDFNEEEQVIVQYNYFKQQYDD